MQVPHFSIIVPAYNVKDYLAQALDSVLCQTFNSFEIVLVNDASTDTTHKICKSYAKKNNNIVYVSNKKNIGLAATRNAAIENASGKWLVFLDSDDFFADKNFLLKLKDKCFGADVIMYGFSWFNASRNESIPQNKEDVEQINHYNDQRDKLKFLIDSGNMYHNIFRMAINRQFLDENNLRFEENFRQAEDFDMTFNVLWANPNIHALNSNQYQYRKDNQHSLTAQNHKQELTFMLACLDKVYDRVEMSKPLSLYHETVLNFVANSYAQFLRDYARTFSRSEKHEMSAHIAKHKYLLKYGTSKTAKVLYSFTRFLSLDGALKFSGLY